MLPVVAALINAGLGILGNAVATKGKDLIEEKLGVNITNLLGTEEGKIKLLTLQTQHEEFLIQQDVIKRNQDLEEIKIEQANTSDARDMQKEALKQQDVFSKRFIYYLASCWSFVSMVYIFMITFVNIPTSSVRFADTILGFLLGTIIATILNFFFGSSTGSHAKDTTLLEAVKGGVGVK